MSANRYSKSSMYELAKTLTECELFTSARIASQKGHLCNGHCFCCICREVYNKIITDIGIEEYGKDLEICRDMLKEIALEKAIKLDKIMGFWALGIKLNYEK